VFEFYQKRGVRLPTLKTDGAGHGCNECVFMKEDTGMRP